jgi:hypothetical protein
MAANGDRCTVWREAGSRSTTAGRHSGWMNMQKHEMDGLEASRCFEARSPADRCPHAQTFEVRWR